MNDSLHSFGVTMIVGGKTVCVVIAATCFDDAIRRAKRATGKLNALVVSVDRLGLVFEKSTDEAQNAWRAACLEHGSTFVESKTE